MAEPVDDLDLPVFDRHQAGLHGEAFHRVLSSLASRSWVARTDLGPVVLEREAVAGLLRDRRLSFPAAELLGLRGVEGPVQEAERNGLMAMTGPAHARLRRSLSAAMPSSSLADLRPVMRRVLEESWRALGGARRCEAVAALAQPLPAAVVAHLLGLQGREADVARWSATLQSVFKLGEEQAWQEVEQCQAEVAAAVEALLARRRGHRGDDLVSRLAEQEGDGTGLGGGEAASLVVGVLAGGVDTTRAQIAHALRLFAQHPEQWQSLVARPERCEAAAVEVLRYEPVTPFTARLARQDVVVRDVLFPAGSVVFCCLASANRDARLWPSPDAFDAARQPVPGGVLTFGAGPHFCAGAHLAQAQVAQVLRFLASRSPQLCLDGEVVFGSVEGIYEVKRLPLAFGTA